MALAKYYLVKLLMGSVQTVYPLKTKNKETSTE